MSLTKLSLGTGKSLTFFYSVCRSWLYPPVQDYELASAYLAAARRGMSSSCRWRVAGLTSCVLLVPSTRILTSLPLTFSHPLLNRDLIFYGEVSWGFFIESSSPKPLKITLGSYEFFQTFAEIFTSQGAPVANNRNNINLITPESELEGKNLSNVNSTGQRCPNK